MIICGLCHGGDQKRKGPGAVGIPSESKYEKKKRKTKSGVGKKLVTQLPGEGGKKSTKRLV